MNKYRSLERLLQVLRPAIDAGQVAIDNRWSDDEEAIGLYKPGVPELAASVTTHGQPPGWYDIELEFPFLEDDRMTNALTAAEDIQLDEVLGLLAAHFDLTDQHLADPSGP